MHINTTNLIREGKEIPQSFQTTDNKHVFNF